MPRSTTKKGDSYSDMNDCDEVVLLDDNKIMNNSDNTNYNNNGFQDDQKAIPQSKNHPIYFLKNHSIVKN